MQSTIKYLIKLMLFSLAWCMVASCATVDAEPYVINGQVLSESGSSLSGLKVSISKKEGFLYPSFKETGKAVSDSEGYFSFGFSDQGEYLIEVWHPRKYVVIAGRSIEVDRLADIKLSITVEVDRLD